VKGVVADDEKVFVLDDEDVKSQDTEDESK
jgi:hypothetical protein